MAEALENQKFKKTMKICLISWWIAVILYAAVALPLAFMILGNTFRVGYITQYVTLYGNIISLALFFLFVMYLYRLPGESPYLLYYEITSVSLIALQLLLFVLHYMLSDLTDFRHQKILERPLFYTLHQVYFFIQGLIWITVGVLIFYFDKSQTD
ncbi:hypothetical protein SAMN04515674_11136 [Pseudarcicella hirudinis]|uniref:DUF4149 domain-containing protein n=2 Tax=Pseudarcicella hirudinis TaxID=1079859 RepID=A0A1I5W7Y1_9BACT|nr:hypothetical protein SAMN04515674_11136 [Pseudarcicella hirudinis]